jgi:hypothetical protein
MAGTAVRGRLSWQTASVTAVTSETDSVRTIGLEVPGWAGHQAGQHLDVRLTAARSILDARGSGWLHAFVPRVPHDDAVLAALRSQLGRRGIRGGPGVGQVRREPTCGGTRT